MTLVTCRVSGCTRTDRMARGWCGKHYQRWRKYGDPLMSSRGGSLDELIARCVRVQPSGCWMWNSNRSINHEGYAVGGFQGRAVRWHRLLYITARGPIFQGLHLDHLCRTRWCVNPWHGEPVTPAENQQRGLAAARAFCSKGHPFDATTPTKTPPYIRQVCTTCVRENTRRYRERRRGEPQPREHCSACGQFLATGTGAHCGQPVQLVPGKRRLTAA